MNWYGVVCLATTSAKAKAVFRYSKIQPNSGWAYVIATPEATKTQHRAVLYFEKTGAIAYYNYQWIMTDAAGNEAQASGTFQTR